MSAGSGRGPVLTMNTLVQLTRRLHTPAGPRRLAVPEGMTAPLGCDAVAVPARFGPLLLPRLPRVGCVYADATRWWWIVPSDSDYAVEWPAPAQYAAGAILPDSGTPHAPGLIHRPDDTVPYTPPIPLYLAVCRLTGTVPSWSRPVNA
ncbi:hypothetical protein AB0E88_26555 [Streptomyces sp. NPDC028635]|uniref:hypothetical protein n=1 Tax=Streptomyces sp. NPDC028635 TaxID=3154800 RepID=UPI0033C6847C